MDLENLSKDDAMEIQRDQGNEYHQRLYDGDPTVKGAVERAYARAEPVLDKMIRDDLAFQRMTGSLGVSDADKSLDEKNSEWASKIAAWKAEQGADSPPADMNQEQAGGESAPREFTPEEVQVTEALREQFGDRYDEFEADGNEGLESILLSLGVPREEAVARIVKTGILSNAKSLEEITVWLADHGKSLRKARR